MNETFKIVTSFIIISILIAFAVASDAPSDVPSPARIDVLPQSNITTSTSITGDLTVSTLSNGGIVYTTSSGKLSQEVAQFYWDEANNRLGIGTSTPAVMLHLNGASSTLRVKCFTWDDDDGSGVSYSTVSDGVMTTTTTKPSVCQ